MRFTSDLYQQMLSVDVRSGDFTLTPLPQDVHVLSNWHTFTVEYVEYDLSTTTSNWHTFSLIGMSN
ncbi:hypothetical protein OROGR_032191 [Orobanche gracilis]